MSGTQTAVRSTRRTRELILPFVEGSIAELAAGRKEPDWLRERRQEAWKTYEALPVPTLKDEAWRRTDLRRMPVKDLSFTRESSAEFEREQPDWLSGPAALLELTPSRSPKLDADEQLTEQGIIVLPLIEAARKHPEILEQHLGHLVPPTAGKFAALASAMAVDGMLVVIPEGVHLAAPIHARVRLGGAGQAYATRMVVVVENNASGTVVFERTSSDEDDLFYTGTVELFVGDGGALTFADVQAFGTRTWNMTHERASVGREASCEWMTATAGSKLTKTFLDLDLVGEGGKGRVSGFFTVRPGQHLDLDTQQNHLAPHTTSDLLYKGALRGRGRSVWQGMIYVAPGAQNTDGYQANRNLLLNRDARADSIPGLEILADDVRCTHGATAGQLDENQMFYLMSRGLRRSDAEHLVIHGFFAEVMQRIPIDSLRQRFVKLIDGTL